MINLSPAPWTVFDSALHPDHEGAPVIEVFSEENGRTWTVCECAPGGETDAQFIALARNAFEILMRRGWLVQQISPNGPWMVCGPQWAFNPKDRDMVVSDSWLDPFTALVEADAWYKANVEK